MRLTRRGRLTVTVTCVIALVLLTVAAWYGKQHEPCQNKHGEAYRVCVDLNYPHN